MLPDAAKARIDDMVKQLMADPKGAYFETSGPANCSRSPRPSCGSCSRSPLASAFQFRDPDADPNQLVVRLDPSTGFRFELEAHRADRVHAEPIELDMLFSEEGGKGPHPTKCCSTRR